MMNFANLMSGSYSLDDGYLFCH